ncbi:uncharacterized protein DAT39_016542, partial [Clarias magur]
VTRKLAGADAGTTQWMTSVGNERGQVLMSVLTAAEGYGLRDMATGLQERYRQAGQDPPSVLYVDRDCCRSDGGTCAAAALFPEWPQLAVRLDVWHYIRRLAAGVTTESHTLYSEFLRRLSRSIFEWDPEDFARLDRAKNGELSRRPIAFKEMARHCRRRTRGVEATERLLDETIKAFTGATDMMGIPVLDSARMREIWRTQRRHIACIQDPSGIRLYTQTGQLTKGGVVLPVYRCARGSTSLESFHLHLNRFIPGKKWPWTYGVSHVMVIFFFLSLFTGTSARGCYFQMYLLEGLTRWNEDRAQQAAGKAASGMKCYRGQGQHTLNQLTQHFFGKTLVESYTKPLEYTGELIGVSYLYAQTGKVMQDFPTDPDEADGTEDLPTMEEEDEEDPSTAAEDEVDEGFGEVFFFHTPDPPPPPPLIQGPAVVPSTANVGVYGTSGYQQVVCLAHSLVELCVKGYVTDAEAEHLVERWQNLAEVDKQAVSYPPRYRQELAKGRFKKPEVYAPSDTPVAGGLESLKRCVAGTGSGLVQWPDASRLVEAVFIRLTVLHPASKRMMGGTVSRWTLVLRDYNTVRNVVTGHPALGARTTIQLFAVNQATLSQWHKRYTAAQEGRILHAGLSSVQGTLSAQETLLSAWQLTDEQRESFRVRDPFHFQDLSLLERGEKEA